MNTIPAMPKSNKDKQSKASGTTLYAIRLEVSLLDEVDAFIESDPYKLSRPQVIKRAIREFLDRQQPAKPTKK